MSTPAGKLLGASGAAPSAPAEGGAAAVRRAGDGRAAFARAATSLAGLVVLALAWELAPRAGLINRDFFPPLSAVLAKLVELMGAAEFWGFLAATASMSFKP